MPTPVRRSYECASVCDTSFRQLKFFLTFHSILWHFNPSIVTEVHTGASGVGISVVLVQRSDQKGHFIAYARRSLSKVDRKYTITEKECLAVNCAVQRFHCYLYRRPFKLITDHHALCWLLNLRDPSGRLVRYTIRFYIFFLHRFYITGVSLRSYIPHTSPQ